MKGSDACEVCGRDGAAEHFEIRICATCCETPEAIDGVELELSHEQRYDSSELYESALVHEVHLRLSFSGGTDVSATFTHERGGHRLVKLFRHEYQAGDPRFDDAIYIRDKHRKATEQLLSRPGAREAILRLVGERGELHVEPGVIDLKLSTRDKTDVDAYIVAALGLAQHIRSSS